MAAAFYSAAIEAQPEADAVRARIAFLEGELDDMREGVRDAEQDVWSSPTDPAARARLEVIYAIARDISATIIDLRRLLPTEIRIRA